jgi:hypothetical protein
VAGKVEGYGAGDCALASCTGTARAKASKASNGEGARPSRRRKRLGMELVATVLVVLNGGKLVELCRRAVSTFSFLFIKDSFFSFHAVAVG